MKSKKTPALIHLKVTAKNFSKAAFPSGSRSKSHFRVSNAQ
jgi:hypothetical protein